MENKTRTALVGSIQKFSTEDGPGIRTTVFLKGCPLNCAWCHNPELISFKQQVIEMPNSCIHCGYCLDHCPEQAVYVDPEDKRVHIDRAKCSDCFKCTDFCFANALHAVAKPMTAEEIIKEVVKDKGFYEKTGGGMTVSGGEMLAQAAFTEELIRLAAEAGIRVCLDTCGYGDGETLLRLAAYDNVSHILYDIKSLDDEIHLRYTGKSNALILENLRLLAADEGIRHKLWMRMPLMHEVNDGRELMAQTADLYSSLGLQHLTLLPYHDLGIGKKKHLGQTFERFTAPEDSYVAFLQKLFEEKAGMEVEVLGKLRKH